MQGKQRPRKWLKARATKAAAATGLVYALDHGEAEAAGNVVEGKLIVCDHEGRALFDPGSTHSFIALHFVFVIGTRPKQLQVVLIVTTPVGRKVLC